MRLERLIIDSDERTLAADFHPSLTVIDGTDPAMRESVVDDIISSLAGARPGVHVELTHNGRGLTVFRPGNGPHRVVDTDAVVDVTQDFVGADGEIDVFTAIGVERSVARRVLRLTGDDLVLRNQQDEWIAELCARDQEQLWESSMRFRSAEQLLERVSADTGCCAEDELLVQEIEHKHAGHLAATETYERIRLIALTLGTVGALAAVAATQAHRDLSGTPFLAITVVGLALARWYRRVVDRAAEDERAALRDAGASDYSRFQFERVSTLLDTDNERRRFMMAVSDHRRASAAWKDIAGDVPLRFALDHEREIRAAAQLLADSAGHGAIAGAMAGGGGRSADATRIAELAQAVLARIASVHELTGSDEWLPLVLDDPFAGLDAGLKPALLEMLTAHAGCPQMIVVTQDRDVIAWAAVETLTGNVGVVQPTIERSNDRMSA